MTSTEQMAVMEFGDVWEPGLPLLPGTFDTADQYHLLDSILSATPDIEVFDLVTTTFQIRRTVAATLPIRRTVLGTKEL